MSGGEGLADLADDVQETVAPLLGPGESVDVLLGHSLGALTALKFGADHPGLVRRLVLEDPPDSKGGPRGFEGVAQDVEAGVAHAQEDPDSAVRNTRAENPSWAEEDVANSVANGLACDAGPVAEMVRGRLRGLDLPATVGVLEMPTLLVLGDQDRGSVMLEPERAAVAGALKHGAVEVFETGHCIHREDFGGYVRLLSRWLGEGEPLRG